MMLAEERLMLVCTSSMEACRYTYFPGSNKMRMQGVKCRAWATLDL